MRKGHDFESAAEVKEKKEKLAKAAAHGAPEGTQDWVKSEGLTSAEVRGKSEAGRACGGTRTT